MKFLLFAASHRKESYNRKLAVHVAAHIGGETDLADYADFDMPLYNDSIPLPDAAHRFARRAASADGIVISSPEYNWSYPGSLKNIIDWTSRIEPNPLKGKTVMLLSASPGARGGILGMDHLKTPLEAMQLHVFHRMFPLGNCREAFDAADKLFAKHRDALNPMIDSFVTFTRKLTKE